MHSFSYVCLYLLMRFGTKDVSRCYFLFYTLYLFIYIIIRRTCNFISYYYLSISFFFLFLSFSFHLLTYQIKVWTSIPPFTRSKCLFFFILQLISSLLTN
ncbi:unnamed protein product [Phytomonas sp. Hart1]|nr:unnamed protein product [Phytomonas sp. Hart1]|eukprot:CCW70722.1 unnamed protein product [Phytomonas sp. isolate Hart1]